jgi:hypothetical protein
MNRSIKLHTNRYGTFDDEEKELINKYNALGLVLTEDANEMAKTVLHHPGVIELILETVLSDVKEVCILPSETFDVTNNDLYAQTLTTYINRVKKMFSKHKFKFVVAVFAIDLGDDTGHYGSIIVDTKTRVITIFDSMQSDPYGSVYSEHFAKIAWHVFNYGMNIADYVRIEPAIQHPLLSLEFTGGFSENEPAEFLFSNLADHLKPIIKVQHTDSQNHFCYMWSIWYIDLVLHGKILADVLPVRPVDDGGGINHARVQEIHAEFIPIIVIKKYIWCILHRAKINKIMLQVFSDPFDLAFFNNHFMTIWWNPVFDVPEFHRYRIDFRMIKNVKAFDNATPTDHGAKDKYNTMLVREDPK